jgi:hypothetical protein
METQIDYFVDAAATTTQTALIERMQKLIPVLPALSAVVTARWLPVGKAALEGGRDDKRFEELLRALHLADKYYSAMAHALAVGFQAGRHFAETHILEQSYGQAVTTSAPQVVVMTGAHGWESTCKECSWKEVVPYRENPPSKQEPTALAVAQFLARHHRCHRNPSPTT